MLIFDDYRSALRSLSFSPAAPGRFVIVRRGDKFAVIEEQDARVDEPLMGWFEEPISPPRSS